MEEIEMLMFFTYNIQWCVQMKMRQHIKNIFKRLHNEVITTSNSLIKLEALKIEICSDIII